MKLANMILAMIVLALAGTSVYFANVLHTKRHQVQARGDDLAATLVKLAPQYDALTQTEKTKNLLIEALHHTKSPAELRPHMNNLDEQFNVIKNYRDVFVNETTKMADCLFLQPFYTLEGLNTYAGIPEVLKTLPQGAISVQQRDENEITNIAATARMLDVRVSHEELADVQTDTSAESFRSMNRSAENRYTILATLQRGIIALSSSLDVESSERLKFHSDFTKDIALEDELKPTEAKAAQLPRTIEEYEENNRSLRNTIAERERTIETLHSDIKNLIAVTNDVNIQIGKFNNVLNQKWPAPDPWSADSTNILYMAAEARVTGADREQKFITFDWGKNFTVTQPWIPARGDFSKPHTVAAGFPSDGEKPKTGAQRLLVFRGDKMLICAVNVTRVLKDYAVANIEKTPTVYDPADEDKEFPFFPQVGDKILFLSENLALSAHSSSANAEDPANIDIPELNIDDEEAVIEPDVDAENEETAEEDVEVEEGE